MIKPNKNKTLLSFRSPEIAAGRWSARGKFYFCFCFIFICLMLLPGVAAAQTRLDMALPEIPNIDPGAGIASFIKYIFVFGLGAIALLALAQMMVGGIEYVLAAGNVTKHEDAKDRIQQALIGMGLLLVSYLLLNTINPDLVNLKDPTGLGEKILFKGAIPANMSVEEYLELLKQQGKDPSMDMSAKDKKIFVEKNLEFLNSDKTKADIETMLKDLSTKPNGTSITLPVGYATKFSDFIQVCNPKCIFEPLRGP